MITLNKERESYDTGLDTVVIQNWIDGKNGGVSLDLTGYDDEVIFAGHVIVFKDGKFSPAKVSGDTYEALGDAKVYGVAMKTHKPRKQGTAIMTRGKVNEKAYTALSGVKYSDEVKKALVLIEFVED